MCVGTTCPSLVSPEHGIIASTSNLCGDNVTFECDVGFQLLGSYTRQCDINSLWSGTQPVCNGILYDENLANIT